jgi:Lrp/AsnC family transcriptional regulator, leucine-responsive regulatory protein
MAYNSSPGPAVDAIDVRILGLLAAEGRLPITELARRLGLSSPSITERVRRLEADGVLTGYTASIDLASIGYPLTALVRLRPVPGRLREVEALLQQTAECIECDKVTGEDCFIARIALRSIQHLDQVLEGFADIAETNSALVKSTPVARRLPPLRAGAG